MIEVKILENAVLVFVDGVCVYRNSQIKNVVINDQREKKS